jgi:type II secretory ATPase GspE/PulE/Tfp pilus assembly ATPase PilB-like protein
MNANQRTAVYATAAAIAGAAVIYGLITNDEAEAWLRVVDAGLGVFVAFAPVLALRHVTPDDPTE